MITRMQVSRRSSMGASRATSARKLAFSSACRSWAWSACTTSLLRSINQRAKGLPNRPPAIMPKVADARAAVVAPMVPRLSAIGPKAAAAPKPPSSETAPAMIPSSGSMPSTLAAPTPTTFCNKARPQQAPR
ncbi:hypothetical protein D3C76_1386310 [compost metagenome]